MLIITFLITLLFEITKRKTSFSCPRFLYDAIANLLHKDNYRPDQGSVKIKWAKFIQEVECLLTPSYMEYDLHDLD